MKYLWAVFNSCPGNETDCGRGDRRILSKGALLKNWVDLGGRCSRFAILQKCVPRNGSPPASLASKV